VQNFAPFAGTWQSDTISIAGHGRQVKNDRQLASESYVLPDERKHTVLVVRGIKPIEAAQVVIGLPERRLGRIKLVEILHKSLSAQVIWTGFQQPPIQLPVGVPFGALAKLTS